MKVLVNGLGARRGGAEVFLTNLISPLSTIDTRITYRVLIPGNRRHVYGLLPPNVHVTEVSALDLDSLLRRIWVEHVRVPRLLAKEKFDWLLQVDDSLSPIASLTKTKSMVVFHASIQFLLPSDLGDSWLRVKYWRFLKSWALRRASVPVTVSYCAKGELARGNEKIFRRLQVIYHGIDHGRFTPDASASAGKTMPEKYILSISSRNPHKNFLRLVKAFRRLIQGTQIEEDLVLIGHPVLEVEENKLRNYIYENGLEKRVHLLDAIENADVPGLLRGARLYICPSLFESFGLTPVEAMATGTPCAVSKFSALPEICGDGAHYFDPLNVESIYETMKEVLSSPTLSADLRDHGFRRSKTFSWERCAQEYYQLLTSSQTPYLTI